MKGRTQGISHAVNEALFDVALILATGLFRARAERSRSRNARASPKQDLTLRQNRSVHSSESKTRGEKP